MTELVHAHYITKDYRIKGSVCIGQRQPRPDAAGGADGPEQIGVVIALVGGARATFRAWPIAEPNLFSGRWGLRPKTRFRSGSSQAKHRDEPATHPGSGLLLFDNGHDARPAGGGLFDLGRETRDREAVGRQNFEIVQLLDMAIADVAAGLVAFPDQRGVVGCSIFLAVWTKGASQLQPSIPVTRTPWLSR